MSVTGESEAGKNVIAFPLARQATQRVPSRRVVFGVDASDITRNVPEMLSSYFITRPVEHNLSALSLLFISIPLFPAP